MAEVVFFSNYLNHHQLSFCEEMVRLTDNNFYFVAQKAISEKRIAFGYQNITEKYPFVVKTYKSEAELKKAYELAIEADYVLFGSSNTDYLKQRLRNNQLTIKYSERMFRNKMNLFSWIRGYRRIYINHTKYRNKRLYMLCSGLYAAYDFNRFGAYKGKTYKWGYFPETKYYELSELINKKKGNKVLKILWAGRLLELKHPEYCIEIADRLVREGVEFEIDIIGNGEKESELSDMIISHSLSKHVKMLGSMTPENVRKHMEESDIFLFTSDMREGWGAVLNEAMNSGCACVVSHVIGSSGFLINQYENGVIYEDGNLDDLYKEVKELIVNEKKRLSICINAYKTISELWNSKIAAERFLILCDCLNKGEDTPFLEGPCSRAVPMTENDLLRKIGKL